ncbi:hypothetical protein F8S09_06730 [Deinococcus sp. SDU3-2]|uniref:Uncharacterized protein n=1 Tax=Deinococcus terrestris TaxID=2651870 RepID=A0A7X1NVS3_9DEIO|nr:hypothetical protein [Deinococcus terrestris]MPY66394.1 hypothetical protein [Deinococcus terrestris]
MVMVMLMAATSTGVGVAVKVPDPIRDRQYIYCVDRHERSSGTIQITFRTERINLFQIRIRDYEANSNGQQLLNLPQFRNSVATYLASDRPVMAWRIKSALTAWKAWSSDSKYYTVTLKGVNYICAVNLSP